MRLWIIIRIPCVIILVSRSSETSSIVCWKPRRVKWFATQRVIFFARELGEKENDYNKYKVHTEINLRNVMRRVKKYVIFCAYFIVNRTVRGNYIEWRVVFTRYETKYAISYHNCNEHNRRYFSENITVVIRVHRTEMTKLTPIKSSSRPICLVEYSASRIKWKFWSVHTCDCIIDRTFSDNRKIGRKTSLHPIVHDFIMLD